MVIFVWCGAGGGGVRAANAQKSADNVRAITVKNKGSIVDVKGEDVPKDPYNILPPPDSFVNLSADELSHDDQSQTVTASGHVEFIYNERVLKADRVIYHLVTEQVEADGDVVMMEQNGDVHFADRVEMSRDMKDGYVQALHSTLADGSRFGAVEGERIDGRYIIMKAATYTPCIPCKNNPDQNPLWMIRAKKVTHDTVLKSVAYNKAWLEVAGVPVLYVPYFSHPDGTIKQKSGFLTPVVKLDSQNGAGVLNRYYWAIDPTRDLTVGAQVFTKQAPRLTGEYRQRFDISEIEIDGSTTYSSRREKQNNTIVTVPESLRGHLFSKMRWDMDDQWRSGLNLEVASDSQYLRQYDISSKNVLENQIYAERFDGRDYASISAIAYQDIRTSDRRTDQPNILPEAQARFYGAPAKIFGGRLMADTSFLGLERNDGGDDRTRLSGALSWQRRDVTSFGLVTTTDIMTRGDMYYAVNRGGSSLTDKNKTRLFPLGNIMTSYPLAKPVAPDLDMIVEPIMSITLVPRLDRQNDLPNEDSQDSQLDSSNVFNPNRFPGLDRVEDQSRATYGGRASLNWHDGRIAEIFLGQSRRFQNEGNNFPRNSGLAEQKSDYVGRIKYVDSDRFTLDYGFQLDQKSFNSTRHEIDNRIKLGKFNIDTRYLFAKTIEGVGVIESREQIQSNIAYRLDEDWQARVGAQYDLGEDQGLRKSTFGIDYLGQCLTFSTTIERNLTKESTGDSGTEMMIRLGLKNLGEFQTSGIGLSAPVPDNKTVN